MFTTWRSVFRTCLLKKHSRKRNYLLKVWDSRVTWIRVLLIRHFSSIPLLKMDHNDGKMVIDAKTTVLEEKLIKSENDKMNYRVIILSNGLTALLISDHENLVDLTDEKMESSSDGYEDEHGDESYDEEEDTDDKMGDDEDSEKLKEEKMAACALSINVGSFSDPYDIQGLAHFLEHMVFMGSEKYPEENNFDDFIKRRGGSSNAATDCELTTFYFECHEKSLHEGMDRFSQFFIAPLMKREAMTREREIIHSEFEMSLPSDSSRREQLLGSLGKEGHPVKKFLWGNKKTLCDDVSDEVLYTRVHEFRRRHYSAHRMTLAVQARLSLDTLQSWVEECFTSVPVNYLQPDDFTNYKLSFDTPEFNKLYWVKPVKDMCQVQLTWCLPSYLHEYKSKPLDYVASIMGHEGKGSLLSYLRSKIWALDCTAGNDESGFEHNSMYDLFAINLVLTSDDLKRVEEVLRCVFGYIKMLQNHGPDNRIYNELKTIHDTNFRFKTEALACDNVESLAESMHVYERELYLAGSDIYLEYKPELIEEVINSLSPDKVNIMISSKEKNDDFFSKNEPWFGTRYSDQEIPKEWIESWKSIEPRPEFHLPEPNPYLATDFTLLTVDDIDNHPMFPLKIDENDLLEVWHRQDVKFKLPIVEMAFHLISPLKHQSLINGVMLDLLAEFIRLKFMEDIYPASQTGITFQMEPADLGLSCYFSGYNDKMPLFFTMVLQSLTEFCKDKNLQKYDNLFQALKCEKSKSYFNLAIHPANLVKAVRLSLLLEKYWSSVDKRVVLPDITLGMLQAFAKRFFSQLRIQCLIQGNINKQQALDYSCKFARVLGCSSLPSDVRPKMRVSLLPPGELCCKVLSMNQSDSNSVITNYYQSGQGGLRTSCIIDSIVMIMDEPLFDSLRTKQQLGYDVSCLLRDTYSVLGFSITVKYQENKFNVDDVMDRIETFVVNFVNTLKSISETELEEFKLSLCELKSATDLQLTDEVKRNFAEITSGEYMFDRLQRETKLIPEITKGELIDWFVDHIADGKSFKKLSVQVVGSSNPNKEKMATECNSVMEKILELKTVEDRKSKKRFVTDMKSYLLQRQYYPTKN